MTRKTKLFISVLCASSALATVDMPAFAQSDDDGEMVLETILVTARKREELEIEVPLSLTAFTSADITEKNILNVTELSRLTPNFTYVDIGQRYIDAPVVRGINSDLLDNSRQASSFFVDGVYVTGSVSTLAFGDLERVEVLRGPQSTLFGRATFAGAINYVTKKPGDVLSGSVTGLIAQDGEYEATASLGGPLVGDALKFRLSGRYFRYDGEWQNTLVNPDEDLGGQESSSVVGTLYFDPMSQLSIIARVAYSNDDDDQGAVLLRGAADHNCTVGLADRGFICGEIEFDEDLLGLNSDELPDPGLRRDQWRTSLNVTWENDAIAITSITGYNKEETDRSFDIDFEPLKLFVVGGVDTAQVNNFLDYEDVSQELRVQSVSDSPFQWLVGVYYLDFTRHIGRDFPGPSVFEPNRDREEENISVFGSLEYEFGFGLTLTAEGRYQEARIKVFDADTDALLVIDDEGGLSSAKFTKFVPRITARYEVSPTLNVYGYWARGNRPGDFNTNPALPRDFAVVDEEEIETFEVGAKFRVLDGMVGGEVALFHNDIDGLVTRETFIPDDTGGVPTTFLQNTGAQKNKGFEVSLDARFNERFTSGVAVGYVDAEFQSGRTNSSETLLGTTDPLAIRGNRPINVPKWTVATTSRYEHPIGNGDIWAYVDGDVSYRGSMFGEEGNFVETGESIRVNLRLGVQGDRWTAEVFARNLFDDDTPIRVSRLTQFSTFQQGVSITPSRTRQVGFRGSFSF